MEKKIYKSKNVRAPPRWNRCGKQKYKRQFLSICFLLQEEKKGELERNETQIVQLKTRRLHKRKGQNTRFVILVTSANTPEAFIPNASV